MKIELEKVLGEKPLTDAEIIAERERMLGGSVPPEMQLPNNLFTFPNVGTIQSWGTGTVTGVTWLNSSSASNNITYTVPTTNKGTSIAFQWLP